LQVGCVDQTTNANCDLNTFEQTPNLSELVREFMTREMLPNGFQGYEVPSSMVGKAWNHVSYCCFYGMLNPRDCCVTNWDSKDFFFGRDVYKLEKMLFIIEKFRKVNICEQKLAKWPWNWL
jgi:hypothetical protein